MHADGKSDRPVVPGKSPNNEPDASGTAEAMEERGLAKGNSNGCSRASVTAVRRDEHGEDGRRRHIV